jgi:6-phosphofructo-2-kinase
MRLVRMRRANLSRRTFCVWISMLKGSIETAQYLDKEGHDVKQIRMLNEMNAGIAEGMTYEEICRKWPDECELRKKGKLRYRYPGAGGENYLDVANRLRAVIIEVERMQIDFLLVAHGVVAGGLCFLFFFSAST